MAASELTSTQCRTPHHLQPDDYDKYSWMLLEDHPLRSYPTHCWPDVFSFLGRCCTALKRRWTERLFPVVCLLLMFLMVIQFIASLPYGVSHLLLRKEVEELGAVQWPDEFTSTSCLAYNPLAHGNAIQYAVDAGCTGLKADVWLRDDNELTVGAAASQSADATLQTVYLQPILDQLQELNRDPAAAPIPDDTQAGLFNSDPAHSFTLVLELHVSLPAAWPRLAALLTPLWERRYLSYTNGSRVISRPVTVVLTGTDPLSVDKMEIGMDAMSGVASSIFIDIHPTERDPGHSSNSPPSTADDSPPTQLTSFFLAHAYSASTNFTHAIGKPHRGRFSRPQIDRVRAQVLAAHTRGLRARFTGIPCHSARLRRVIWRMLAREGADLIEVDWSGCQGRWRGFLTFGTSTWERP
ncbi:hypothetical protein BDV59DRAFT_178482 [Aspergillus ambiguus]|uniref:uncharacterized protein n=1 Tax=Aspergillus ambiguus TaxID=176160 RepID=UPI003CCD87AC